MNKSRKKGVNSRQKRGNSLVNYKDLERNLKNEISKELSNLNIDKTKKK